MRRVLLLPLFLGAALLPCCSKPALEPTVLTETRELDAEVLQLVEQKVAAVRAAPSDARAHADLALVYEGNGLWDASEQSFAKALQLDGSKTIWLYHRALALREGGQSEPALAALREAAGKLPTSAAVQQRLGQWLLDGGDPEGARAAFEQALRSAPDRPEFLTGLAGVELARERWNEAFQLAKRALKVAPSYALAHFVAGQALQGLGRQEEAKIQLAAGMNSSPVWYPDELTRDYMSYRLTSTALSADAAQLKESGNFSRAVELYEKLVLRKPEDLELLNNLGASLLELGRLERAEEVLRKALAISPQAFAVHFNLCELHLRRKQLPEARAEAEKAVELGGGVGRTHYELAKVLMLQKDTEGAYRELKAAIELDARNVDMFLALTDAAARLGRVEEARGWCRKALELVPNSVPGLGMQGLLAIQAGDADQARATLALLEKLAPQDSRTTMLRNALQPGGH